MSQTVVVGSAPAPMVLRLVPGAPFAMSASRLDGSAWPGPPSIVFGPLATPAATWAGTVAGSVATITATIAAVNTVLAITPPPPAWFLDETGVPRLAGPIWVWVNPSA